MKDATSTYPVTEEQALNRLRAKIGYDVKIKDLAEQFSVSPAFMSRVLAGKDPMTEVMMNAVNVRKIVTLEAWD